MAPVIPHICEELNERMGNKNYVSLQMIPDKTIQQEGTSDRQVSVDIRQEGVSDRQASIFIVTRDQKDFAFKLIEDIEEIVKLLGKNPKKIHIYINAPWKNELYELANELFKDEAVNIGKLMSVAKEHQSLSKYMKEIANEAKLMLKDPSIFRIKMLSPEDQEIAIDGYQKRISTTFGNAEVKSYIADKEGIYDPQNKAQKARPMKPALLLE
jgi:leucyl-tRNA synthetase